MRYSAKQTAEIKSSAWRRIKPIESSGLHIEIADKMDVHPQKKTYRKIRGLEPNPCQVPQVPRILAGFQLWSLRNALCYGLLLRHHRPHIWVWVVQIPLL